MPKASAKCGEMYLLSRGSGHPVLFLHGVPTSCRLWDGIVERMFGDFTCISVDLPGLGRTSAGPDGFRKLDTLAARLEALRIQSNIEKWHIVGHDAGCAIAVHYAHSFPERVGRLALLSPSIFPDLKPFFLFEILRKPVLGELLAPFINLLFWRLAMRKALEGQDCRKATLDDFHAPFRGPFGAWRLMSFMRWGDPAQVLAAVPALLPSLSAPTMIFHGLRDPAIPQAFATRASGLIPNSQAVFLDSGHFLPVNQAGPIADSLLSFFAAPIPSAKQWETTPVLASA